MRLLGRPAGRPAAMTIVALCACLEAGPAAARMVRAPTPPTQPAPRQSFWERLKNPHQLEIIALVNQAVTLRYQVTQNYWEPHLWPARRQVLRDAADRYLAAYRLDRSHHEHLLEAAHVLFEAGDWVQAEQLYREYRERAGDGTPAELVVRYNLGESLLRQGRLGDAETELEEALAGDVGGLERARYLTLLGYVYLADHRLDDAGEVCERAAELFRQAYGGGGEDLVSMALLAVIYDRDEQSERAHEAIDALRALDPSFMSVFALAPLPGNAQPSQRYYVPFAPPADKHYFAGLFYEAQGRWGEAVAAWRAYLESADPGYAARAREHLASATKQQAEALATAKKNRAAKAGGKAPPRPTP